MTDHGTLQQIRNLINRRNIVADPSKDVNACEDFLSLVVTSHVLCAGMKLFNLESLDSFPENVENVWNLGTKVERQRKLYSFVTSSPGQRKRQNKRCPSTEQNGTQQRKNQILQQQQQLKKRKNQSLISVKVR